MFFDWGKTTPLKHKWRILVVKNQKRCEFFLDFKLLFRLKYQAKTYKVQLNKKTKINSK